MGSESPLCGVYGGHLGSQGVIWGLRALYGGLWGSFGGVWGSFGGPGPPGGAPGPQCHVLSPPGGRCDVCRAQGEDPSYVG